MMVNPKLLSRAHFLPIWGSLTGGLSEAAVAACAMHMSQSKAEFFKVPSERMN